MLAVTQSDVPRRAPGHSWAKGDGCSSSCSTANQFLGQSSLCWRQRWTFPELHLKFWLNFTNWVGWNVCHWQREHRDFCVCVSKTVHRDRVRCTLRPKVSLLCLFEMGPADGVTYTQSGSNCGSGPKMCQWTSLFPSVSGQSYLGSLAMKRPVDSFKTFSGFLRCSAHIDLLITAQKFSAVWAWPFPSHASPLSSEAPPSWMRRFRTLKRRWWTPLPPPPPPPPPPSSSDSSTPPSVAEHSCRARCSSTWWKKTISTPTSRLKLSNPQNSGL